MIQEVTFDIFIVSLLVLLLVLIILMILSWILRRIRSRNLTELQISAGQPIRILTIRTDPDHTHQLLDHLLDRIFLQVEARPESRGELEAESGEEHFGSYTGLDPGVSTTASFPSRAVNVLRNKLWKWVSVTNYPPATPRPSTPPPPADQDQTDDLCTQQPDVSQHASLSSQDPSCSAYWVEEEQCDESQLRQK